MRVPEGVCVCMRERETERPKSLLKTIMTKNTSNLETEMINIQVTQRISSKKD